MDEARYTAIREQLARYTAEARADPALARARLIAAGLYMPNGDLAPHVGGPGWEAWLEANPDAYTMGPAP